MTAHEGNVRHNTGERPAAADEIAQHVDDEINAALNPNDADNAGHRDITQAIVQNIDNEINDTEVALDRGPHISGDNDENP